MTNFKQETDIPSKSVLIIHTLMNDKRLGKTPQKRLSIAYIYGLLRRTDNLSFNDIKNHYSKKYNIIYLINRVKTLQQRSGFSKRFIMNALNVLDKCNYINRYGNRIKHLTYITLPLVLRNNHLTKQGQKDVASAKYSLGRCTKVTRQVHESNQAGARNAPRCNDSYVNDSNSNDSYCNVQDNQNKQTENSLNKWFKSTIHNHLGLPKNTLEIIRDNASSDKQATNIVQIINDTKVNINMKYKNVYHSNYYKTETNPYIQGKALVASLMNIFKLDLDPKEVITKDYKDYISKNSGLTIKTNNNKHKPQNTGYQPDIHIIEKNLRYEYKSMKQAKNKHDKAKHEKAYNAEYLNAKDYCNVLTNNMSIDYVKYTPEWLRSQPNHFQRTPAKVQDKIKKQLKWLNNRDKDNNQVGFGTYHNLKTGQAVGAK